MPPIIRRTGEDAGMDWWWSALALVFAFGLALLLNRTLDVAPMHRTNYRGRAVPTGGGIVAAFAFVLVCAAYVWTRSASTVRVPVPELLAVLGFGGLGLFDDVVGSHSARGLRGHIRAGLRGQLTSGATKLIVGIALAGLIAPFYSADTWRRVLAVFVIAGAANAANLFDLAPARATKVAAVAVVALVVAAGAHQTIGGAPAWFFAAVLGLTPIELRERMMLGDAGANALGAMVGIAAVRACGGSGAALVAAAAVVLSLNAAGEFVSFSRIIDRVPPLRVFDRFGRAH